MQPIRRRSAQDSWVPEAGEPRDAHGGSDGPRGDAPADQKAGTDGPVIHDAAIDIAACSAICNGCCDATGKCQSGKSVTTQCGASGALCIDCTNHVCPLPTYIGCCTAAGACGCAAAGILCN